MKNIISLLFTLLLFSNTVFAFPNEPEGFRELKWGDSVKILFKHYPNATLEKTFIPSKTTEDNNVFTVYKSILKNKKLSGLDLNKEADLIFCNDKFIGIMLESTIIQPYADFSNIYSNFFENMTYLFGPPTEQKTESNLSKTFYKIQNIWSSNISKIQVNTSMIVSPYKQKHTIKILIFQQKFFDIFINGELNAIQEEIRNQGW